MEEIGEASAKGLDAFPNSGTVALRTGDILCFTGGPGGYGHVAIIMEVTNTYVKIVHQNILSIKIWGPSKIRNLKPAGMSPLVLSWTMIIGRRLFLLLKVTL